jgi:sugar-specific transcriptional regulator TrmB
LAIPAKDIQLLTKTGLTQSQAHLYLALLKKGKTNAACLSRQTGTPRTETYRILNELQEIGLVEKQLRVPYVYQAISIKDGAQSLLTKKFEEYKETRKKINELRLKIEETPHETEPQIIISKGKQRLLQVLKTAMENVKLSIDVISTEKRWCQIVGYFYNDIKECLDNGVGYRGMLEETVCQTDFPDNLKNLLKNPNFDMKRLKKPSETNYAIFDSKEAVFNYTPLKSLREATTVWTNHPSLLTIFKEHFGTLWETAQTLEF